MKAGGNFIGVPQDAPQDTPQEILHETPHGIPVVVLYAKEGCCLCSEALKVLLHVRQAVPFTLVQKDITEDERLMSKYQYSIPVVAINGKEKFAYEVDEEELKSELAAAMAVPKCEQEKD
ncbi:Glutaredoxin-like domain (DUF836) [Acididesulfobacillus acetoxydans]|uniref:Glutaredoxin-like domain (DUF836) n=1 Tax=Acididesulfobacillus acetoxydans TaxID=1561005 RepID=A0A8S0VX76_9FIRM|nr:glutaredoxin family protein [Acididesulfobacillus acetoxydans]CAA7601673.1 Glutaredoxin-like domain (DUF836) [Acididesulfobacillus acetoxydans]CEJ09108.1 Thioredoxin-like fold [Acididesulfobacillus acetoxydans]